MPCKIESIDLKQVNEDYQREKAKGMTYFYIFSI